MPQPSYTSPGSLISLGCILPTIGLIVTLLRFHTRRLQKAPLLADDWMIIPAEILLIALGVALIVGVAGHGEGYKVPTEINGVPFDPSTENAAVELLTGKVEFLILTLQCLQLGFVKLSILLFYRRIFCTASTKPILNIAINITMIITALWSISFFFANLFECGTNFPQNWTPIVPQGVCIQEEAMNEGYIFADFILDVMIFFMPIFTIYKLHMSLQRRIAVILIFAVGALAVVASLIKVIIVVQLVHDIESALLTTDPDILVSTILFWTVLESGVATIAACLPTLRSLVNKSPDILRSLRSMLSLNSLASHSNRSRISGDDARVTDERSVSSQARITNKMAALEAGMGTEAYAMQDVQEETPALPSKYGITVKSQVMQGRTERV